MDKKLIIIAVLVLGVASVPVISFLGGAIVATSQSQCTQMVSGFAGSSLQVSDYELNDQNQLLLELRNGAPSSLELESVTIDGQTEELSDSIGVGRSTIVTTTEINLETSESCNELPIEFEYSTDTIQQTVTGTLTGRIRSQ